MVVERDARQRRDVYLVFQVVGYLPCQQGVQRVDALYDQHRVAAYLQLLAVILAFARGEVILRHLHALTLHQPLQVVFHQLVVHSLDVVEVVVAVGQLRRVHAVHEVVVGRERGGPQTACQQLHRQALAECRLARTRRTRYQHQPHGVLLAVEAAVYLLGYLHNLLLLQRLAHLYQLRSIATHDGLVHVARVREPHDDVPPRLLGKHAEGLRLFHLLRQAVGVVPVGHPQQQTVLVALQPPHLQVACRRHQRPVVVVHGVAQRVVVAVYLAARLQ